jgi:hypothetical protein
VIQMHPIYQQLLSHIGLDEHTVFTSPSISVWRKLDDRENCTLDATWPNGTPLRLHIKRYPAPHATCAQDEATAIALLKKAQIPCLDLVAWGRNPDGRGFFISQDLAGYEAADKFVARGQPFDQILIPTADLAAKLHGAGFHHRDLYLCHFFVSPQTCDIKLIDAARVRPLPRWPMRQRWIVKDLAQFWYSLTKLPVSEEQRNQWLKRYSRHTSSAAMAILKRAVNAKVRRISLHDKKLNQRQSHRNISIPS